MLPSSTTKQVFAREGDGLKREVTEHKLRRGEKTGTSKGPGDRKPAPDGASVLILRVSWWI